MITIGESGFPKPVRVGIALVDGKLWSSGTQHRVRTWRLRRDPRCTLFVFDQAFRWLALETTVTILEGPSYSAPAESRIQLGRTPSELVGVAGFEPAASSSPTAIAQEQVA